MCNKHYFLLNCSHHSVKTYFNKPVTPMGENFYFQCKPKKCLNIWLVNGCFYSLNAAWSYQRVPQWPGLHHHFWRYQWQQWQRRCQERHYQTLEKSHHEWRSRNISVPSHTIITHWQRKLEIFTIKNVKNKAIIQNCIKHCSLLIEFISCLNKVWGEHVARHILKWWAVSKEA